LCSFNLIISSIRRIEIAASVAKRSDLIFEMAGSTTPDQRNVSANKKSINEIRYLTSDEVISNLSLDEIKARVLEIGATLDRLRLVVEGTELRHEFGGIVGSIHR
jgi:hypothetical protein